MTLTQLDSWRDVGLRDLFFAYRKAKADCHFERSICIAREFAQYEQQLPANLSTLLKRLQAGQINELLRDGLGTPRVTAKKLGTSPKRRLPSAAAAHGFFSDPKRAFARLTETHDLTPEFRIVGAFPIEMHILSALWINHVGHKFDAVLSRSSYGSRVRRYRPETAAPEGTVGDYHLEAIGSFQPYFGPYRAWRENGLAAIRRELTAERAVIAISMDLTSYYHRIDASFMSSDAYLKDVGVQLSEWERSFTDSFVLALKGWSAVVGERLVALGCKAEEVKQGGVPIGLSIVRVAANALLAGLDRDIERGLAPVYYGRYVDDLFIVLHDPGNVENPEDLLRFIAARTKYFPARAKNGDELYLRLPRTYAGQTSLLLQPAKQKLFFLKGQGGLDLLANIETQIRAVSSERRLMPSPERLESMASAKVLTAAAHASDEADTLRRADGLAVRRLGWSIQLRAVETLARDLRQADWLHERRQFYEFAHSHILRPDKILDHVDYLPRLLSLAVALLDWSEARRLIDTTLDAIDTLHESTRRGDIKLNGLRAESASEEVWALFRNSVLESAAEAIARSLRWSQRTGGMRPLSESALQVCELVGLGRDSKAIEELSLSLRESDWAKTAYKDHLRRDATRQRPILDDEDFLYGLYEHESDLREFLSQSQNAEWASANARVNARCLDLRADDDPPSLVPFLFPTRPYSAQEIALFLPGTCVFGTTPKAAARDWARYVRALRGVWVRGKLVDPKAPPPMGNSDTALGTREVAVVGEARDSQRVRLGISSLLTTDESWSAAATGRPDISPGRYARIERLVNQAIEAHPRPTHLLLPELSLPERWIDTVSGRLQDAGISLIAGLDYFLPAPGYIGSEAVLVLSDDRLGFRSTIQIRQPKSLPAPREEETLLRLFGREWPPRLAASTKPTYVHFGFQFGVLVCSELQNVMHRHRFQGDVDCVMILAWNQDLETFSSLVESASLDVHAHIALVNNRRYGDSRVRTPAKPPYERDACRLRGGQNEHVVVVELEIGALRAFQSRDRRWPRDEDPYKPVPEGFSISDARRAVPK